jgi:hypothetical protein
MRKFLYLLLGVCLVGAPAGLIAQSSYGTVAGSVTDSTGAAIPNAVVTLVSRDTGETRTVKSNSAGGYYVDSVGTGHYDVSAEAPNFAKTVVQNVLIPPSVTTSVNEVLKVGASTETVEVAAGKEILQTESGELSANVTGTEISELPISSLNPTNLVTTLPGVTTVTVGSGGNGPNYSVNGSRPRANNYLIEGQDDNDAGLTGEGLKPDNTESFDNVTFLLNGYSAEFGYAGGGVSNIVFKSGTNKWHGSIYDRLLNSSLNAIDHNNRLNGNFNKTKFRENIYGGTIGFPILHDRLFMFAGYQQDHYRSSSILSILTVPTVNGYAVLNQYKSNPRIANLINAYGGLQGATAASGLYSAYSKNVSLGPDPVTGVDRGTVEYGGVQRTVPRDNNYSELDLKSDWQATQADKVQFRLIRTYSLVPYDTSNFPSQLPHFDTNQGGPAYNAGIVYTHIFSPHLLNEFRLSYGRIFFTFDLRPDTYSNPLALGPTVAISGVQGYGIPTNVPQGRAHNTYQLQDAVSYTHGQHTLKFGFDIGQIRVRDLVPFIFYGSMSYTTSAASGTMPAYTALANYMDDYSGYTSTTGQSLTQNFGSNVARPVLTNQNYYAQDHWKVGPRIAVDFGLRWEYTGAPFNYLAFPATDMNNPFGSFTTRVAENPKFTNFGPRLGFAYQPFEGGKTVVRGAFGMFYDHSFTNMEDNVQATAPNAASPIIYGNKSVSPRGTPSWSGQFASLNRTPQPLNGQTTLSNNLRNPLTYQYNLAIEQQLPGGFGLTIGYAGSRSLHLYALDTLNPVIPSTSVRLNPSRNSITFFDNAGDSDYNGLELELEHKLRRSLEFRAAYTYSKALDDVSDPYTSGNLSAYPEIQPTLPGSGGLRGRDWGLSAYDHRQRAVGTIIYTTPSLQWEGKKRLLAHILNNYTVSTIPQFQSGSVYNVEVGLDINNDGISNDRPVLANASAPVNTWAIDSTYAYTKAQGAAPGVYCDGSYVANAKSGDAFCHPVTLDQVHWYAGHYAQQNNTVSRDLGITPGLWLVDAAAERTFKLTERQGLSFRAESFNVLNHANTGVPSFTLYGSSLLPIATGYGRGTFANYASTQAGGRTLRFFLRYAF